MMCLLAESSGGDEFAVILPNTSLAELWKLLRTQGFVKTFEDRQGAVGMSGAGRPGT